MISLLFKIHMKNLRIWISSAEFGGKRIDASAVRTSAIIIIGTKSGKVLYSENRTYKYTTNVKKISKNCSKYNLDQVSDEVLDFQIWIHAHMNLTNTKKSLHKVVLSKETAWTSRSKVLRCFGSFRGLCHWAYQYGDNGHTCTIATGWSASQSGSLVLSLCTSARTAASKTTTASGHNVIRCDSAAADRRCGPAAPHAAPHTRSTDTTRSAHAPRTGWPSARPNRR